MSDIELIVCIGIPASGKSTWAKEKVVKNNNYVRVNRDSFRLMLKDAQECENKIEKLINDLMLDTIELSLGRKLNVIVDNTNLKAKYINELINRFSHMANIKFRIFDISLEKALERDENREMKVGKDVIERMYKDYLNLIDTFDFTDRSIQPKVFDYSHLFKATDKEKVVICDLDGTLALHNNHRNIYDHSLVEYDDVNHIVKYLIDLMKNDFKILFVTGRDEKCRVETTNWLASIGFNVDGTTLLMREADDNRRDVVVKGEIFDYEISNKYTTILAIDDRISVSKMWAEKGVFCINVNQGLFNF